MYGLGPRKPMPARSDDRLGNRRYLATFSGKLPPAMASLGAALRHLLDIDFFKAYNDLYGHGRGDDCIRTVAEVIGEATRLFNGSAVRYGGEELILLLDADKVTAAACADVCPAWGRGFDRSSMAAATSRPSSRSVSALPTERLPR